MGKKYSLISIITKLAMTDKGKKDVIGIVKFDRLIGLLPTDPTKLLYYNGIPEFMRRLFSVNIKIKQRKIVEILLPKIKLTEALAVIIGRFHTLIWRPGDTVQNLESPRC